MTKLYTTDDNHVVHMDEYVWGFYQDPDDKVVRFKLRHMTAQEAKQMEDDCELISCVKEKENIIFSIDQK